MSQTKDNQYVTDVATDDDYSHSVQVASEVFDLVALYMTPPKPKTYELWYSYASRDNEALREDVEDILRKSGTLSEYDIDQILSEYRDNEKRIVQAQDAIGKHFDKELSNILQMMETSADRSQDYSNSLGEANEVLPGLSDPAMIRDLVQKLILRNKEMQVQTEALSENLNRSKDHIQSLRDDLEDLRARSLKDPLTQVGNRGFFDATLAHEVSSAKAAGHDLCLVMTDIDHFKKVNDVHGHVIGDWILKDFAAMISSSIKGRDSVARYGGEEFGIVLPMTDVRGARSLIENIRRQFEGKERILKTTGKPMEAVTASFGIASLGESDDSLSLLSRADEKLYEAKRGGRNKTVTDELSHSA